MNFQLHSMLETWPDGSNTFITLYMSINGISANSITNLNKVSSFEDIWAELEGSLRKMVKYCLDNQPQELF